jgi:hypothetical protein
VESSESTFDHFFGASVQAHDVVQKGCDDDEAMRPFALLLAHHDGSRCNGAT